MSTCIPNSAMRCIDWCQEKTLEISAPLPANHLILDIVKRILIVASLIIPLIGLIANYLECNKQLAPILNAHKVNSIRTPAVSQSSALQILNPPGKKSPSEPNASQRHPAPLPVISQEPSPPVPNASQVQSTSTPVNPQGPSTPALNGRKEPEGYCPYSPNINVFTGSQSFTEMPVYEIVMYGKSLTEPPNVSIYPQLQNLDLCRNKLAESPDVSKNSELQNLNLAVNKLAESPVISKNPELKILKLNGNKLTVPPDVSKNPKLQTLDLDYNQLIVSPVVSNNPNLQKVNLFGNQLSTLSDSFLSLSSNCIVDAQDNFFTYEYAAEFQARLVEQRKRDPSTGPQVLMLNPDEKNENLAIWP